MRQLAGDDDRVWREICERSYGRHTRPERWLAPGRARVVQQHAAAPQPSSSRSAGDEAGAPSPATFHALYPLLEHHASLVGLWTGVGSAPAGSLFSFRWQPGDLSLEQLLPQRGSPNLLRSCVCRLGPGHPEHEAEVMLGGSHLLVRAACRLRAPRPPSAGAEAAAAVAGGGAAMAQASALGASPPNSFSSELLRFMAGAVAPGARRRRSGGGGGPLPPARHLARLAAPRRTRQHPLAGLWQGREGAGGGSLVVSVSYDFSGMSARILGSKVLGDPRLPCGEVAWEAAAQPLQGVLPAAELQLLSQRGQLANTLSTGELAQLMGAGGVDGGAGADGRCGDSGAGSGTERGGTAGGGVAAAEEACVVAVHAGRVRVVGPRGLAWLPGRLWVYDNGAIALVWVPPGGEGGDEEEGITMELVRLREGLGL